MANLTGRIQLFPGDTSVVDTTAQVPAGAKGVDQSGNEYIYLQGVASAAANSWVSFDEAHLTTLLVANAVGRVAVAMAAVIANTFGWFQIYGSATGLAAVAFADNGLVYSTATAGTIDDAVVVGDLVVGAIGRSAVAAGVATFELNYPFATNALG